MSEENVEIVRRVYEGWARGDFSEGKAFHPEVEFEMRGTTSVPNRTTSSITVDNVLVLNSIRARGKGSRAEVSAQTATVWTLKAGKVVRLSLYWDTARAHDAAERPD
jgi:ketosteroid isomerase-like protein